MRTQRRSTLPCFAAALLLAGCSSSNPGAGSAGAASGGSTAGAGGDGGAGGTAGGGTAAGGTTGGGTAGAGTGGHAGAGSGGSGGSSGGSGGGTGASGGASGSGAGTGSSGDAAGTGGSAVSACDGMLPDAAALASSFDVVLDSPSPDPSCALAAVDGGGGALAITLWGLKLGSVYLWPLAKGAGTVDPLQPAFSVGSQDSGPDRVALSGSSSGFLVLPDRRADNVYEVAHFAAYDAAGARTADGSDLAGPVRLLRADPATGGGAVLSFSGTPPGVVAHLELVDPQGHRRAGLALDAVPVDVAVSSRGHALLVNGATASWLDGEARPLGAEFDLGEAAPASAFPAPTWWPLADGGFALQVGGAWTASLGADATAVSKAPAWLTPSVAGVRLIRGGKAQVLVPSGEGGAPLSGGYPLAVVLGDGTSCGTVSLAAAQAPQLFTVGADGSALALFSAPPAGGGTRCTWRVWPQLFR